MSNSHDFAFSLAQLLADHKAIDVTVLDLRNLAGWTDFFVLATATSITHMRGLSRFVDEKLYLEKHESLNKPVATNDESWLLHDLGDVIVHIMNADARSFYELEKLWFKAAVTKVDAAPQPPLQALPQAASLQKE